MTKVSVFGEQPTETKELKKIEFVKEIISSDIIIETTTEPYEFKNVMLIEIGCVDGYDAILAWDEINNKIIYLGHWNDGVV